MTLIYHSSLHDAAAVLSPIVGTGVGAEVTPSVDFPVGKVGNCARFNNIADWIKIPGAADGITNILPNKGTFQGWMKPLFADESTLKLSLFSFGDFALPGNFNCTKHNASNLNALALTYYDGAGVRHEQNVIADVWRAAWQKGVWSFVKYTYDWTVPVSVHCCHLWSDGLELPIVSWVQGEGYTGPPLTGPQTFPLDPQTIWLGTRSNHSYEGKVCWDEVQVFDEVV